MTDRPPHQDRPVLGIVLMLGFCVLAPLGDSLAKLLGAHVSVGEMIAVRFAVQFLFMGTLALALGRPWRFSPRALRLTAARTVLHVAGVSLMFLSLQYLPLADAVAIAYVMPFILMALGWLFMGDSVGPHRIGAALVGFAGTLFVLQPNLVEAGPVALLPLGVAVVFALFMLVTRALTREVGGIEMQAVSGAMAVAALLPVFLVMPNRGFFALTVPDGPQIVLLALLGLIGSFSHLVITWSLRFAPSATLAPMQYLEIPFAALLGWLIFRDLPSGGASFGIVLTVAAGLYIIAREERASRARRRAAEERLQAPPGA